MQDLPTRDLICSSCAAGCGLHVERLPDGTLSVSGNRCPRGLMFAEAEINGPGYVLTAACGTDSRKNPRLPVRTDAPCPRDMIDGLLGRIYALEVKVPVGEGDVVLNDISGIRVLAARTVED